MHISPESFICNYFNGQCRITSLTTNSLKLTSAKKNMKNHVRMIRNVRNYFTEYCNNTSIHGFKYFGEKRTICEKLWWITVFSLCISALCISIVAVYRKWNSSPIIVTFATKPTPIFNIPFPAITVCSEYKLRADAYNYSALMEMYKNNDNLTAKEIKILNYMAEVCTVISKRAFRNLTSDHSLDVLSEITPINMPINCKWMKSKIPCELLFAPIVTDEGLCFTFNMLDRSEMYNENVVHHSSYQLMRVSSSSWSMESGYLPDAKIYAYPRRALLPGGRNAFTFDLVTFKHEIEDTCRSSAEGYKVLLHSPITVPRLSEQYFRIPFNHIVVATVRPFMMKTSLTVKKYPPEKRECYFSTERPLKYFNIYSKVNCNFECITNYTLRGCKCVHFTMPRENGTRICGGKDISCIRRVEQGVLVSTVLDMFKGKKRLQEIQCNCLPLCTDIEYNVGVSQTNWNWPKLKNKFQYRSKVSVYFLSGDFIPSERNRLYGPMEFVANFGGLLSLFTGFSLLSLIEIIYFLSVRLVCNVRIYGHWWSPSD